MPYEYFLNKVFGLSGVIGTKGTPGTMKEKFSLPTIVENEWIKRKLCIVSQVSELMTAQKSLAKIMKVIRYVLAAKDIEIIHLKLQNQTLSYEVLGSAEKIAVENANLKGKVE